MGESYDSLGSRVVRHFRHYIDGKHHVWLRGNFCDEDSRLCQTAKHQALHEVPFDKSVITDSLKSAIASKPCSSKFQNNNVDVNGPRVVLALTNGKDSARAQKRTGYRPKCPILTFTCLLMSLTPESFCS